MLFYFSISQLPPSNPANSTCLQNPFPSLIATATKSFQTLINLFSVNDINLISLQAKSQLYTARVIFLGKINQKQIVCDSNLIISNNSPLLTRLILNFRGSFKNPLQSAQVLGSLSSIIPHNLSKSLCHPKAQGTFVHQGLCSCCTLYLQGFHSSNPGEYFSFNSVLNAISSKPLSLQLPPRLPHHCPGKSALASMFPQNCV